MSRTPDPDCPDCGGQGVIALPEWEGDYVDCPCGTSADEVDA